MEPTKTSSDEIDLQELLLKVVFIIRRNFNLIALFFVIGTLLGFSYSMIATKVYESKLIVTSDILTESYVEKIGENLFALIKDNNLPVLASKLHLTEGECKNISSIKIESAQKEKPQKDEEKKWVMITVRISDQDVLPKLEQGLVSYLENNEYVKVRVEQKRNLNKELIKKAEEEISSLEKFKSEVYNGNFFANNKGNVMFDPTVVNVRLLELNKEKLKYQNDLEVVNSVQIVEGFTRFEKPVSPNKAISLTAGATLGLFFVGALLAFKSIRKIVRLAEENEKK